MKKRFFTPHQSGFSITKYLPVATICLSGIILYRQLVPLATLISQMDLNDWSVYRHGVTALTAGRNPYLEWWFDRYNYSPAASLLWWPLTVLPLNISEISITIVSLASLWLVLEFIIRLSRTRIPFALQVLLFTLILKTFPVKLTLILGQSNLIILCLIITSYYLLTRHRPVSAGLCLGIATVLKLTPAPLIILFIIKRNWRALIVSLATFFCLNILAIAVFGWPVTQHYYTHTIPELLSNTSFATVNTSYMNQSLTALLGRWGIYDFWAQGIRYLISVLLFITVTYKLSLAKDNASLSWYVILTAIATLIMPIFVWQHHYVFSLPVWLTTVLIVLKKPQPVNLIILVLTYSMLNLYFHNPNKVPSQTPLVATHFLITAVIITLHLIWVNSKTVRT